MGRPLEWSGEKLTNLLELTIDELCQKYPNEDRNKLRALKSYHTRKIKRMEQKDFGDILRLHNMNPELAQEFQEQGFHVGYIKNSDGEIEYTIPLPNAKNKGKQRLSDFISQADPVVITPSTREPIERDHKLIVAFSDSQIDYRYYEGEYHPIHDERALAVVRMVCADLQPDFIVNLGDTVDLSALSRFDKDSDHFNHSLQPAFNRTHQMYAELRADNPNARIVEVDSNHNSRLKKFILNKASELYGLRQAGVSEKYPAMSYPFLANLEAVGVEWVSGYGAAEFVYGEEYQAPPIVFKHGMSSGQNVAAKEASQNPYTHIVRGHTHRPEMAHRTTRSGEYLTYMVVGVTCSITGEVPSVYSAVGDDNTPVRVQEKWQQGMAVIHDYQDGTYQFDQLLINKGVAKYNGKEYRSE